MHKPNTFTKQGAWYDGWETRRHNPEPFDWVVFRLGVRAGRVKGVEIDTGFFNGNQAPEITVEGCCQELYHDGSDDVSEKVREEQARQDQRVGAASFNGWQTILPRQPCGPACRQAWIVPSYIDSNSQDLDDQPKYTHIRLLMHPDGGIGRFRLYGTALPLFPPLDALNTSPTIDLASLHNGGLVTACSDQHFSPASNLLLPGLGTDMSDGWETKRSRSKTHVDWVIVRLGARGAVDSIDVDTSYFKGNFPREVQLFAANDENEPDAGDAGKWTEIVKPAKCAAHKSHVFQTKDMGLGVPTVSARWIKLIMIPDGGIKRLRVYGRRV